MVNRAQTVSRERVARVHEIVGSWWAEQGCHSGIYLIPSESPNAFATVAIPHHSAVAVTKESCAFSPPPAPRRPRARAIARFAIETSSSPPVAGRLARAGKCGRLHAAVGNPARHGSDREDRRGSATGHLVIALIAPLVAVIIQLRSAQPRVRCWTRAGACFRRTPRPLAEALERIEAVAHVRPYPSQGPATRAPFHRQPFTGRRWRASSRRTPPVEERVARLSSSSGAPSLWWRLS